jgi:hypothetical protein
MDDNSNLENMVKEGLKKLNSQETINGVVIATALKTFLNLTDIQAAGGGIVWTLITDHLNKKELSDGQDS